MMQPPARPDKNRQTKYQDSDSGKAQAKKASEASSIMQRKMLRACTRLASGRPSKAPAR